MLDYDISQPPPTRQELAAERSRLTALKKRQITASLISDGCHGAIFLILYLTDLLSGLGLIVAISTATLVAVALATSLKKQLAFVDVAAVVLASLATIAVVTGVAVWFLQEELLGALLAGVTSGSIVIVGGILGRKFFHVFSGLDQLKNVAEDEFAVQEMQMLCRKYPELEGYRQQALEVLRPNLTFGELQAMRNWVARQPAV